MQMILSKLAKRYSSLIIGAFVCGVAVVTLSSIAPQAFAVSNLVQIKGADEQKHSGIERAHAIGIALDLTKPSFPALIMSSRNSIWRLYFYGGQEEILRRDRGEFKAVAVDKDGSIFALSRNGVIRLPGSRQPPEQIVGPNTPVLSGDGRTELKISVRGFALGQPGEIFISGELQSPGSPPQIWRAKLLSSGFWVARPIAGSLTGPKPRIEDYTRALAAKLGKFGGDSFANTLAATPDGGLVFLSGDGDLIKLRRKANDDFEIAQLCLREDGSPLQKGPFSPTEVGGLSVDEKGTIYVSDAAKHSIQARTADGVLKTVAGGGTDQRTSKVIPALGVASLVPYAIAPVPGGGLFFCNLQGNNTYQSDIRFLTPETDPYQKLQAELNLVRKSAEPARLAPNERYTTREHLEASAKQLHFKAEKSPYKDLLETKRTNTKQPEFLLERLPVELWQEIEHFDAYNNHNTHNLRHCLVNFIAREAADGIF